MKKDLDAKAAVFPLPVLMIGTYDENGVADVMNAAWGTTCGADKVAVCLGEHKTTENIRKTKAFTIAIADAAHAGEADYFGIASAGKTPDKFARSGLTAVEGKAVHAPVVQEFPLTMECEFVEDVRTENFHAIIGKVVNVVADESILNEDGSPDAAKLNAILFDCFGRSYFTIGERIAGAWDAGMAWMK